MRFLLSILLIGGIVFSANAQGGKKDTINFTDGTGMKQGHWVYLNKDLDQKLPDFKDNQKVKEGEFLNNQKNGRWTHYYNTDKIKEVITYQSDRPNGYAIFYYPNGNKREEGTWRNNRWVGDYKYYHENGKVASDWKYNAQGTRTGVQKYYHENGKLMIEGEWNEGKEVGVIKEYYDNGELKSEKAYNNGAINVEQSKSFERKTPPGATTAEVTPAEKTPPTAEVDEEGYKTGAFDGNGKYKMKDARGKVVKQGLFKDGALLEGKQFTYTADGRLFRTIYIKGGKEIGRENHLDR